MLNRNYAAEVNLHLLAFFRLHLFDLLPDSLEMLRAKEILCLVRPFHFPLRPVSAISGIARFEHYALSPLTGIVACRFTDGISRSS